VRKADVETPDRMYADTSLARASLTSGSPSKYASAPRPAIARGTSAAHAATTASVMSARAKDRSRRELTLGECMSRGPAPTRSGTMRAMLKLAFLLLGVLGSYVLWSRRQSKAHSRLAEIDSGRRCIACDGTDIEAYRGVARCRRCGHAVSLAALRAAVVSEKEVADVTQPEKNDRY
jgi:hypothetical protein